MLWNVFTALLMRLQRQRRREYDHLSNFGTTETCGPLVTGPRFCTRKAPRHRLDRVFAMFTASRVNVYLSSFSVPHVGVSSDKPGCNDRSANEHVVHLK